MGGRFGDFTVTPTGIARPVRLEQMPLFGSPTNQYFEFPGQGLSHPLDIFSQAAETLYRHRGTNDCVMAIAATPEIDRSGKDWRSGTDRQGGRAGWQKRSFSEELHRRGCTIDESIGKKADDFVGRQGPQDLSASVRA